MSSSIEIKKQAVESIKEKISNAKSFVLIDYKGITVEQDTKLRKTFRENDVEYKVLKNTLVRRALNDEGKNDWDEALNGPTAIAFAKDETTAARVAKQAIDGGTKLTIKCGMLEGKFADQNLVMQLASIPGYDALVAQLAGMLNNIIASLPRALKAVADAKKE
jgi:large subunit ribosomal protein L10